jgi:hypothetical protein
MAFIKDDELVQILPPDRADHALDVCVLPRGACCSDDLSDSIAAIRLLKTEPYEASRSRSRKLGAVSQGNTSLSAGASRTAVGCCVTSNPAISTIVSQDDREVEQSKRSRHGDEHVDGGDTDRFVAQKAAPCRRRPSDPSHHVLCDRGLADLDAEFQELAVDAGRTPQGVGFVHLPDQITNFAIY